MNESNSTANTAPRFTWSISLSFWLTLLFAAAIFASVTLAPKMIVWLQIRGDYVANQVQLIRLEEQVLYLERVAEALENDPDFAAEMARVEFNAYEPGDERIPVDESLSLSSRTAPVTIERPEVVLPWYAPMIDRLATRQRLRSVLLGVSAVLVIFAFTFLHEECEPKLRSGARAALRFSNRVLNRYVDRDADDEGQSAA